MRVAEISQSLDRRQRLRQRREFLEVYAAGGKLRGHYFFLYVLPRPGKEATRLGITASRKVGTPVVRNRMKRRIREIFRRQGETVFKSCDIVFNLRRSAAAATYQQLEAEFEHLARRWSREKAGA